MKTNKNLKKQNYILLLVVLIIPVVALWMGGDSEFGGADTMAADAIDNAKEAYTPWFESVWAPPGGETESLLFALQAAIGTGVLAYFIGYIRGKKVASDAK
ncbi:energy-coupling factor ABC transporter substrate-binding protein [Carboxylicivirga mesophila]|uniref:Cobalt transport protein CbiN n=1 Tax=Carboxylicivirga mesophila TaxID=1166478 RepID=A0ABS5KA61_9BACT|nr:energy-coupling factor ABC transporter substrate-binding protein [Carboxylicivirga mesophila]MBS2211767.1 energy-coupling factor ABC transporter substrate-binding protein [Carboxylicivirga mesophila]